MLIKEDKQKEIDGKKVEIYINKLTGKEGTLKEHTFRPCMRKEGRLNKGASDKGRITRMSTIHTNRKSTNGRITHQQVVNEIIGTKKVSHSRIVKGERVIIKKTINITKPIRKTIKHIQETPNAISRKTAILSFYDKVQVNKNKNDKSKKEK